MSDDDFHDPVTIEQDTASNLYYEIHAALDGDNGEIPDHVRHHLWLEAYRLKRQAGVQTTHGWDKEITPEEIVEELDIDLEPTNDEKDDIEQPESEDIPDPGGKVARRVGIGAQIAAIVGLSILMDFAPAAEEPIQTIIIVLMVGIFAGAIGHLSAANGKGGKDE